MALVVFRSRAASEVIMFADAAHRLLELAGKPVAERGVITAAQIDDVLARLQQAVEDDKAAGAAAAPADDPAASVPVTLRQRAFPLIEMLRAAQKRQVDVTWGI
jgi:hypothetical protein